MRENRSPAMLLLLFGGLIVWAVRFGLVYAFAGIICAKGLAESDVLGIGLVPFVIGLSSIAAVIVNAAILARGLSLAEFGRRASAKVTVFIGWVAAAVAALSILAVVWETLPVLVVSICK